MAEDMSSIPPRLNQAEREIHTLSHRVGTLEALPDRVSNMEADIGSMKTDIHYIKTAIPKIESVAASLESIRGEFHGFITAVKVIGGLITLAAIGTTVVIWLQ